MTRTSKVHQHLSTFLSPQLSFTIDGHEDDLSDGSIDIDGTRYHIQVGELECALVEETERETFIFHPFRESMVSLMRDIRTTVINPPLQTDQEKKIKEHNRKVLQPQRDDSYTFKDTYERVDQAGNEFTLTITQDRVEFSDNGKLILSGANKQSYQATDPEDGYDSARHALWFFGMIPWCINRSHCVRLMAYFFDENSRERELDAAEKTRIWMKSQPVPVNIGDEFSEHINQGDRDCEVIDIKRTRYRIRFYMPNCVQEGWRTGYRHKGVLYYQ